MLRDARTIDSGELVETDICIIGAGPAGITVARALEKAGIRVVLLESGSTEHEPFTLELTKGEIAGHPYYPLHEVRAAGFGGTTSLWPEEGGLRSRPLDPIDFETRDGVPHSGWPFGRDELEPFCERAHKVCLLSPRSYNVADWEDPATTPRVSLRSDQFYTTIFKFTSDIGVFRGYLDEITRSEGTTLLTRAHVAQLNPAPEGGSIESIDVVGLWNTAFTVKAKVFVLASGGIENARLLLLSGGGRPSGVGNQYDLVGRYFMEHLRISSGILVPNDRNLVNHLGLYRRHFVDGWKIIGILAPSQEVVRSEKVLNGAVYFRATDQVRSSDTFRSLSVLKERIIGKTSVGEKLTSHLRNAFGHPEELWRALRSRLGSGESQRLVQLVFQTEQAPNPTSRVTLGQSRDPLGFPRARVHWQLSEIDTYTIRRLQELLNEELRASGIGRVERMLGEENPPAVFKGNWHLMGTTRMHTSPRKGVVNPDCRVHGLSNLYVAGSSVFPTSGYANPTLTIVAMALRLAEHLTGRLRPPRVV